MARYGRGQTLERALQACVSGEVAALPELFADDVSGWSPVMHVSSLDELSEVVSERDGTLSDVTVAINALDVVGNKGFAEYVLSGTFSGPLVMDGETLVEPNGREVLLGGALVAEFTDDKISAFRNYFDEVTLLVQMVD